METKKEHKAYENLSDAMNNFNWDPKEFAEALTCDHRTLQQTFCNTMIECIRALAKAPSDARNQAAVDLCRNLMETGLLDRNLPMI